MKSLKSLSLAVVAIVVAQAAFAAEPAWIARSNENSRLLLQLMAKYSPESATRIGVDGYEEKIADLSRDKFDAEQADYRAVIEQYRQRLATEQDSKVKQDLEILIGAAQDSITSNALERKYFFPFIDLTSMLFGVTRATLDPRVPAAQQKSLLVRLRKYAGLERGFKPVTELARERTLERIKADDKLLGPYRGEVEQALNSAPALISGMRELLVKSKLKGWERSYAALTRQLIDYNSWLKSDILPRARTDSRLPPEVYADNLRQVGVDIPPEELISRALIAFAELRVEMSITAAQVAKENGLKDRDYRAVIRQLKLQQIAPSDVLPLYKQRLAEIEAIIRKEDIVSLPDRAASIRVATAAENAQQPAPHMSPPRLIGNTGEYGEFVLTTGMSPDASGKSLAFDDFTHPAITWTLTAHEARPGHELQFAKMIESGVSIARAVFAFNRVNAEGWALYAEAEVQPYEPADGQLFTLMMRAHRAARAFLDPMVNLGQIAPDGVKAFLMNEVGLSEGMAAQEVQRYTFRAPGQATSYFYGYQRLMETRQRAQLALGGKFDRKAFNDFVLAQGLLPPDLLRQAVMTEFVPSR
ncbi:MAG: DUF885 domain-containing protein [Steroidobacteraceae bacterium]